MDKRRQIWKLLIYSLAVLIVAGLSVALAIAVNRQNQYRIDLENMYEKSFYDTLSSVSLVSTDLDKLSVATTNTMQRELLADLCRECQRAGNNLAQLKAKEEPIEDIIKFLHQLGDYCNYLSEKVTFKEPLSQEEHNDIQEYAKVLSLVRDNLQSVQEQLLQGKRLMGKFHTDLNYLPKAYNNINNAENIEFPEINYDGPFSDDVVKRQQPEALKDEKKLTAEQCRKKIISYFPEKDTVIKQIGQSGGQTKSGKEYDINLPNYVFSIKKGNHVGTMQLSKQGGFLINYDSYKQVTASRLSENDCIAKAKDFVENVGYKNMKNVWSSNYNSIMYINFVYEKNGIIVYPDMIKVKIACDTGDIIGFEAQNYLYNHKKDRDYSNIRIEDINYEPNEKYKVIEQRIAIIPTEFNTENLVAEYVLTYKDTVYYVYVDVNTFEEDRILKQVDDNGKMLV